MARVVIEGVFNLPIILRLLSIGLVARNGIRNGNFPNLNVAAAADL